MAFDYQHSMAHAKKWGGVPEDYLPIDEFLDSSKQFFAGPAHRMLYHHTGGVFLCEKIFGKFIKNSDGRKVPVRYIAEEHIKQDFNGRIPTPQDWMTAVDVPPHLRSHGPAEPVKLDMSGDDDGPVRIKLGRREP